jgi:hypothetical protein
VLRLQLLVPREHRQQPAEWPALWLLLEAVANLLLLSSRLQGLLGLSGLLLSVLLLCILLLLPTLLLKA